MQKILQFLKVSPKMHCFHWTGINLYGDKTYGIIQSCNKKTATEDLRKKNIVVKKIAIHYRLLFNINTLKSRHIAVFARQLATMIHYGIPLTQAFELIIQAENNPQMLLILDNIKKNIAAGVTLSTSLATYPQYFNPLFCSLIESGEQSGSLDIMLLRIANYKEKLEVIKKKIKQALTYPTAILLLAFLIMGILLLYVVPQFEQIFASFGATLPWFTRGVILLSRVIQTYGLSAMATSICIIYLLVRLIKHSPKLRAKKDCVSIKLPLIGQIITKILIARFTRTLAITYAAGLPLVESLNTVAKACGNSVYANASDKIKSDLSMGKQLHTAMASTGLFPHLVTQMIAIGEESGTLEKMLAKSAEYYEEEIEYALDTKARLLEPFIMTILGILVGGLVIAMYLPIFTLGQIL